MEKKVFTRKKSVVDDWDIIQIKAAAVVPIELPVNLSEPDFMILVEDIKVFCSVLPHFKIV